MRQISMDHGTSHDFGVVYVAERELMPADLESHCRTLSGDRWWEGMQ
jgi:hypothetical protein